MRGAAFGLPACNPFGIPAGVRIPGGCDDCHAWQEMDDETDEHGIWHLRISHDDTCPTYRRRRATNREATV